MTGAIASPQDFPSGAAESGFAEASRIIALFATKGVRERRPMHRAGEKSTRVAEVDFKYLSRPLEAS